MRAALVAHYVRLHGMIFRDCLVGDGWEATYRGKGSGDPPTKVILKKPGYADITLTLL
ncbi:MAG: hypothetical protein HYR73_07040 [Candidatus Eisenbacteria bacterium]|nr:hypothetical protein [Candidatus Eisenbacteria bacterium]